MKGVLFDRSLGWRLPSHFQKTTFIPTFTRKDIVQMNGQNPEWKIRDREYVLFAKANDLVLVTSDVGQMFDAREKGVQCICVYPKKPFWEKFLRVLGKLEDPFFKLFLLGVIDLRDVWHDARGWGYPRTANSVRREKMHCDKSYVYQ